MFKFIHTADWHLGHKLYQRERDEEFQFALDWLATYIAQSDIELLIVAGDVFDTDMPPNSARRMYYDFLCRLEHTACRDIVIVGGNHDSPAHLETSKELLRKFRVHVIGQIPANRRDQIIEIRDDAQQLRAVVAAVPFLRDRDLRTSQPGQTTQERQEQIRQGIYRHYQEIRHEIMPYTALDVPIIVTGHLYVTGAERDGRTNTIHIGGMDCIAAAQFPTEFDYVALGHLHRPQFMKPFRHICYSGTLIPLDFNEINYPQVVHEVSFHNKQCHDITAVPVPQYRKIRLYERPLAAMKEKLASLAADVPTWLKLVVPSASYNPNLWEEELMPLLKGKNVEVLLCTQPPLLDGNQQDNAERALPDLSELSPLQVFQMRMDAAGVMDAQKRDDMERTFLELLGG